jgi:hypothetical protein
MTYAKQNAYVDALIALIKSEQDHTKALHSLIAYHDGKRSEELCNDIVAALRAAFPATDACLGSYKQQPTVSFPKKGSGYEFYKKNIAPMLPKLREPTRKADDARPKVDPMIAVAKRLRDNYSAAQIKRLKAML